VIALADRINDALPQTQCTRCGFPDCKAYAQAIALDNVPINQCPPGGLEGVTILSKITGRPVLPLNPDNGTEGPMTVAVIDEAWCIGCTLCLKVCPTDAILAVTRSCILSLKLHALVVICVCLFALSIA
jgi:Na+-translocating ferredoxin:NAD+ oxidoreductase subunit B